VSEEPVIALGPVDAHSVRAFVAFARPQLEVLASDPVQAETFTPQIVQSVRALLDAWSEAATRDPFEWSATLPTDHAEYLLYSLFLSIQFQREQIGGPPTGPDADARRPFLRHLIARITEALAATPGADHDKLAHLTERWPDDLRPG
jgi:hypothetical protein